MKKSYVLVSFSAALILGAAYLGLRDDPIERSPPEATPGEATAAPKSSAESSAGTVSAAQVPPEPTAARAAVNNPTAAAAASARFRSLRQCFEASHELAAAKSLGDCKVYEGRQEFEQAYAECLNGWKDWRNRAAVAEKTLSGCGDVSDIEKQYYEATRAAARAGDPDAQLCYLAFDFSFQGHLTPIAGAELAEYTEVSPTYVGAAIKRGDWRIAYLLTQRSGPVTRLNQGGRPEIVYRMTRLLRHGASGDFAKCLDYELNSLAHPDLKPEAALPPKVIRRAMPGRKKPTTPTIRAFPDNVAANHLRSLVTLPTRYPIACLTLWIEPATLLDQIHCFRDLGGNPVGYVRISSSGARPSTVSFSLRL